MARAICMACCRMQAAFFSLLGEFSSSGIAQSGRQQHTLLANFASQPHTTKRAFEYI